MCCHFCACHVDPTHQRILDGKIEIAAVGNPGEFFAYLYDRMYSGGAAVLITVCVGFPLIAVIINTAMDALVSLHWLSGVMMLAVCITVSILSGLAVFRLTKSAAVMERIKLE